MSHKLSTFLCQYWQSLMYLIIFEAKYLVGKGKGKALFLFYFLFRPIYHAKVMWKKTSLTQAVDTQGQRGGICPQQCASLLRHRCNWSSKTHYRNQKWSEHFPSGKSLHRPTPGETHQEMLEEIASRFTWHFSLGLSDGISCRARGGEINLRNSHGEALLLVLFSFFLWQSNFKPHCSSSSRMCDHNGMLCLLASNSQSTTHCVPLTSSRTIWLLRGVRVAPGHISVTDVVALLMPWVRPMGAKWNFGTRGMQSEFNLNRCICRSLVAYDLLKNKLITSFVFAQLKRHRHCEYSEFQMYKNVLLTVFILALCCLSLTQWPKFWQDLIVAGFACSGPEKRRLFWRQKKTKKQNNLPFKAHTSSTLDVVHSEVQTTPKWCAY